MQYPIIPTVSYLFSVELKYSGMKKKITCCGF